MRFPLCREEGTFCGSDIIINLNFVLQMFAKLSILPIVLGLLLLCGANLNAGSLPDTIEGVKRGLVGIGSIQKTRHPQGKLFGTGFVVGDGLHVITNAHVAGKRLDEGKFEFLVVFVGHGNRPEVRPAKKVAVDAKHDLAFLEISGAPLPALSLGDSIKVREGQRFAFTGFPIGAVLGLYPATHIGYIAAITPVAVPMDKAGYLTPALIKQLRSPFNVYQLDGTAFPGNSGSPLYDTETGEVIAVINMTFVKKSREKMLSDPSGISYAIPVRHVVDLMSKASKLFVE